MQASEIKREALRRDPDLRMSSGNARDVLKALLAKEIVRRFFVPRSAYPRWELTDLGWKIRSALIESGVRQ